MKILFVEPSRTFQNIIGAELNTDNVDYVLVESADQALETLAEQRFDLICMSLYLPNNVRGLDLCKKLRSAKETELTPILLLTAEADKDLHNQAFKLGVTEIFPKQDINGLLQYITHLSEQSNLYRKVSGSILYVEDVRSQARVVTTILENTGLTVRHHFTAESAYEDFMKSDYDLVITDVILEGDMSGLGLVRAIRSTDGRKGSSIPILALSGIEHPSRKLELLRSGINDYVSKPTLEDELITRVKNLVLTKQLLDEGEEQKSQLRKLAMTDRLTGLYNRHYLFERMNTILSQAGRKKPNICVIVMDVDHFKKVNDDHGHQIGDRVLQEVGRSIKDHMRSDDIAARFGGEEFVLVFFECDRAGAIEKAEHLRKTIEALNPAEIKVTASFGVACYDNQTDEKDLFESLLREADQAVYTAKNRGRNQVVCLDTN